MELIKPISEVFNEDCYETLLRLKDGSIDLLLQDTPFGVTQNKWDIKPDLKKMWPEWLRTTKENAAIIFFATQPFASELVLSMPELFKYDLIWYKALGTGFLNANRMPMRNHEHLLVFYRSLPTYNPQKYIGKMREKGGRADRNGSNYGSSGEKREVNNTYFPQSVLDFSNGDKTKESDHPTQKPLPLIRYLIKTYSNLYETVFDGYVGSGTTRIASYVENRHFKGAEMDDEYFIMQDNRFKELVHEPLFESAQQFKQANLL